MLIECNLNELKAKYFEQRIKEFEKNTPNGECIEFLMRLGNGETYIMEGGKEQIMNELLRMLAELKQERKERENG